MNKPLFVAALLTAAAALPAQTHSLRGKVEDVQNTQNQFYLDCTSIPLVSPTIDLNLWIGQEALMQVVNTGTPQAPSLRVDAIAPTTETFEMGNLRFNQSNSWSVFAPASSFALVAIDFTANTGFTPIRGLGSFVLGANPVTLASGFAGANNEFGFQFTMPTVPGFIGTSMTAQALILEQAAAYLSNPDCKDIRQ